ncbi:MULTISPECIES: hypothetical protein [unclassified Coleofasciculus]|uniref:hypothetical protein n=1 Tax=unclassified Coleofasciculus TaxID=2692782 RepID=UPI00187DFD2C|nr:MULTISPECIES: hypothetical protein [unclassified Coleofasciculus]MBE9128901.1 hypothetical protein [Coleofasciculus sp. LEGE 07081]MBE9151658.1 hypothetical protein [Coleofasciculus sp. LEGE 07092]
MLSDSSILLASLLAASLAMDFPTFSTFPTLNFRSGKLHVSHLVSSPLFVQVSVNESPPPGCDRTDLPGCEPRTVQFTHTS